MDDPPPQSGLIVEIPEAEDAVGSLRREYDANARLDVPAHVTVLFPFLNPCDIGAPVLLRLRELFAQVTPFDVVLTHTAWFGEEVLWLAPEDPRPLRALTDVVCQAFPGLLPFGGQFDDVVPHLTVAHGAHHRDMLRAERSLAGHLPIHARPTEVTLMTLRTSGGQWHRAHAFPLGGGGH